MAILSSKSCEYELIELQRNHIPEEIYSDGTFQLTFSNQKKWYFQYYNKKLIALFKEKYKFNSEIQPKIKNKI